MVCSTFERAPFPRTEKKNDRTHPCANSTVLLQGDVVNHVGGAGPKWLTILPCKKTVEINPQFIFCATLDGGRGGREGGRDGLSIFVFCVEHSHPSRREGGREGGIGRVDGFDSLSFSCFALRSVTHHPPPPTAYSAAATAAAAAAAAVSLRLTCLLVASAPPPFPPP